MSIDNELRIIGYLGRDAEQLTSKSGNGYVRLNVGVSTWAEGAKSTLWCKVLVFGKQAEFFKELKKGEQVSVQGRISVSAYIDKSGQARGEVSITADPFGVKSHGRGNGNGGADRQDAGYGARGGGYPDTGEQEPWEQGYGDSPF
jgi:single stranded DNA-binding protein